MAKRKTTKVLALVANGDTGFDARTKINAGLTLTGDLESRIDGKADVSYVDNKVSEKVSKSGDLMTGDLSVQSFGNRYAALQTNASYSRLRFGHPSNGHGYGMVYAYSEAGGDYISLQQYDQDGVYLNEPWTYIPSLNQFEMQSPHSKSSQATAGNALTRKDYVDGNFLKLYPAGFVGDVFSLTNPGSYNIEAANSTNWPWSSGGTLLVQAHGSYLTRLAMNASNGSLNVGSSVGNSPFTWQQVYSTLNPPTALEVGAASIDKVNELEATIATLLSRIEALEGGANVKTRKR